MFGFEMQKDRGGLEMKNRNRIPPLIAGLLSVALRARRLLGAYRIPLETGLLIPSEKRRYR